MNAVTPIIADTRPDLSEDRALTLAEQLDAETGAMEARHLANLEALAEVGMALTKAVGRRVAEVEAALDSAGGDEANGGARELADLGLVFNRVARAVRQTMGLEARVRERRRARLLGLDAERATAASRKHEAEVERVQRRKDFIGELVANTVQLAMVRRSGDDAADVDELTDQDIEYEEDEEKQIDAVCDRAARLLARDRSYAGFADQPISTVLARVCADLGLEPDWRLWAKEDWALEEADALPGSPFAGLIPGGVARGPP